jgi:hypothetical protein
VGGEAPVTPVLSLDSSYLNPSYKPCDNKPEAGAGHSLEEISSNNIHLPPLERGHTQAQLPPALDNNSRAIHLCLTTQSTGNTNSDLSKQAQQWQLRLTVLISRISFEAISAGNYPDSPSGRMVVSLPPYPG